MKTRRIFLIGLFIAVAGAGYWVARLNAVNSAANDEIADLKKKLASAQPEAPATPSPGQGQAGELAGGPAASGNEDDDAGPDKAMMAQMAKLMNTPAMRTMGAQVRKTMAEKNLNDFAASAGLTLTPEQHDAFIAALTKNDEARADLTTKLMDDSLSPDDKAAAEQQMKSLSDDTDAGLRQFFNNDDTYASYQTYTAQAGTRSEVNDLGNDLTSAGVPLDPGQSTAMVNLMYITNKNFKPTADLDFNPFSSKGASAVTDEQINAYVNEQQQLQQQLVNGAAQILSPQQLQVYSKKMASDLQDEIDQVTAMKAAASPPNGGK